MEDAKRIVARLAERQAGRVKGVQLEQRGIGRGQLRGWIRTGYLIRTLPTVYAVGHAATSRLASLWDAILYAGPGAMLFGETAAQWRGLIEFAPDAVEVCTRRRCRSCPEVTVADRRVRSRWLYHELPVTSLADTMLDLAAGGRLMLVRKALGRLDFRHQLDIDALRAVCGPGRAGSPMLRWALRHHDPRFAQANGRFGYEFLVFCENHKLPLPLVEYALHGFQVDAYWPEASLVVELDGKDNHSGWGKIQDDHGRDLRLRAHGILVVHYTWSMVMETPEVVRDDLGRLLRERTGHSGQPRR